MNIITLNEEIFWLLKNMQVENLAIIVWLIRIIKTLKKNANKVNLNRTFRARKQASSGDLLESHKDNKIFHIFQLMNI